MLTSQQEADIVARINLGSSSSVLNNSPDSPLAMLLKDMVQGVVDELGRSHDKYNIRASNNLKQMIIPTPPKIEGNTVSVSISAPFYWKFVNYGVNGAGGDNLKRAVNTGAPRWGPQPTQDLSFKDSIGGWIRNKGITLPDGFDTYDSFSFAIMTNVKKYGQKTRPFFTDVVNDKLIDVLKKPIEKLIGRSIVVNIVEPWQ